MNGHEKDPKRRDDEGAIFADAQRGIPQGSEGALPLPGCAERAGTNLLLRSSEERLRLALEATSEAVWDWALPADRIYQGARWAEMLGYSPATTPTSMEQLRPFIHPDDLATLEGEVSRAVMGERDAITFEHRVRSAAGEWRWMLARARVVERNERGEGIRIVGTCADITAQKLAEDALREGDLRKERFLAVLSHELRNPLGAASGTRCSSSTAPPRGARRPRRRATILDRQVEQLTGLVEELLDVNRIARGKIQLQKACARPRRAGPLRGGDAPVRVRRERGLSCELELPGEPVWSACDATRIAQVLGNLLQNAAKFTNRRAASPSRCGGRDARDRLPARAGHGRRHRAGRSGPAVPAVRAGGPHARSERRRPRPRAGAREGPRRASRRHREGPQRRAGHRRGVRGVPAARGGAGRRGGTAKRAGADAPAAGPGRSRIRRMPPRSCGRCSRSSATRWRSRATGRRRWSGAGGCARTWSSATSASPG